MCSQQIDAVNFFYKTKTLVKCTSECQETLLILATLLEIWIATNKLSIVKKCFQCLTFCLPIHSEIVFTLLPCQTFCILFNYCIVVVIFVACCLELTVVLQVYVLNHIFLPLHRYFFLCAVFCVICTSKI
jgi:hypothetical protein